MFGRLAMGFASVRAGTLESTNAGAGAGPPKVEEVLTNWKQMQAEFPNAKTIRAGKFDEYFELLQAPAVRSQLPVVESEVADSWLRGAGLLNLGYAENGF